MISISQNGTVSVPIYPQSVHLIPIQVTDPAVCEPPIMARYKQLKKANPDLKMVGVLTTHKHHDHSAGNGQLRQF